MWMAVHVHWNVYFLISDYVNYTAHHAHPDWLALLVLQQTVHAIAKVVRECDASRAPEAYSRLQAFMSAMVSPGPVARNSVR